jgi:hypothetical protein
VKAGICGRTDAGLVQWVGYFLTIAWTKFVLNQEILID